MPIKNYVTGDVPYLRKYEPYALPSGLVEAVTLADMISYDLKPRLIPTTIEYVLGSEDVYVNTLNIKNITTNATIFMSLSYFRTIFSISPNIPVENKDIGTDGRTTSTTIAAGQQATFNIAVNNSSLDSGQYKSLASTTIVLTVGNLENGNIITKSVNTQLLPDQYLPALVRIE